jgi:septum formation protein
MRFLLASNSPRRRQLLALAGLDFVVRAPDVDESLLPGEGPVDYVLRVSRAKALALPPAVPQPHDPPIDVILAADTTVVDGSHILGKPSGAVEAEAMLRRLRNRTHQVYTGLALYLPLRNHLIQDWCVTDVPMRSYSDAEMAAYIATGDPLDKAGAYAIQHAEFRPVEWLAGCYANVVGLPLCHMTRMLKKIDIAPPEDLPAACQEALQYDCPVFQKILDGR